MLLYINNIITKLNIKYIIGKLVGVKLNQLLYKVIPGDNATISVDIINIINVNIIVKVPNLLTIIEWLFLRPISLKDSLGKVEKTKKIKNDVNNILKKLIINIYYINI